MHVGIMGCLLIMHVTTKYRCVLRKHHGLKVKTLIEVDQLHESGEYVCRPPQ